MHLIQNIPDAWLCCSLLNQVVSRGPLGLSCFTQSHTNAYLFSWIRHKAPNFLERKQPLAKIYALQTSLWDTRTLLAVDGGGNLKGGSGSCFHHLMHNIRPQHAPLMPYYMHYFKAGMWVNRSDMTEAMDACVCKRVPVLASCWSHWFATMPPKVCLSLLQNFFPLVKISPFSSQTWFSSPFFLCSKTFALCFAPNYFPSLPLFLKCAFYAALGKGKKEASRMQK